MDDIYIKYFFCVYGDFLIFGFDFNFGEIEIVEQRLIFLIFQKLEKIEDLFGELDEYLGIIFDKLLWKLNIFFGVIQDYFFFLFFCKIILFKYLGVVKKKF